MSHHTIIIGAGQAGLVAGYHLTRAKLPFTILEADERIGGSWNHRWDSMRLFTPATHDGLPGMPFPQTDRYPTGAAMAEYLTAYAERFGMDVRTGVRVDGLFREDGGFTVTAGAESFHGGSVILATGSDRVPHVPELAAQLSRDIVQLHSADYRNPRQLPPDPVAVVGAGNSGADIALELAATHDVVLAGRHPGALPFRLESPATRVIFPMIAFAGLHVLTQRTPMGRAARGGMLAGHSGPLIRVKPADLDAAGVRRAGRVTGVTGGKPVTADGEVLDVASVVWCTGFRAGMEWVDLPGLDASSGRLENDRGKVTGQPGLYVLGTLFQYRAGSHTVVGVPRDAATVVRDITARARHAERDVAVAARQR